MYVFGNMVNTNFTVTACDLYSYRFYVLSNYNINLYFDEFNKVSCNLSVT